MLGGAWMLGCSEIAPVHAKTPGNAVPTDGAIVGGQNSSSHLFLGLKPQVRALVWLGTKWENDTRFTVVQPVGPYVHLVFSYSSLAFLYNRMGRPLYRLHGK